MDLERMNHDVVLKWMYLYVGSELKNAKGLSFFLSWVSTAQPKYRTKLMI